MKKSLAFVLLLSCMALLLIAGCSSTTSKAPDVTATSASTPIPSEMPTIVTTAPTASISIASTPEITTMTTAASDPIEHRYIRQYSIPGVGTKYAYEFKFYPGGTLRYREGIPKMVSDNIMIDDVKAEATGTWIAMGNNKYMIKFLPVGTDGAQIIREYTLVPAHEEKDYPGVVIDEHIESEYETNLINKGEARRDVMYYPERAKID